MGPQHSHKRAQVHASELNQHVPYHFFLNQLQVTAGSINKTIRLESHSFSYKLLELSVQYIGKGKKKLIREKMVGRWAMSAFRWVASDLVSFRSSISFEWPHMSSFSFSFVDDVVWSLITAFESVALVSMLGFFFLFCGCTI
ncbi:uncharacterized protein LOC111277967 [Durio zibethinus]|uniref:Uncharacterized protein LOC111277967 n=1 Tax=Durio zibethinus TaxID=66656 RepID=A0A6P5WWZ3_DURZI|nr:uncharacterized protein LOC111277967 [Durio zibethinus]